MEILNNFGIQPVLLLAQIVNFAIILFLLRKFFYAPVVKALEDRKKRIAESLKNAELAEEKLQKATEETTKILDEGRLQVQNFIADAKAQSERIVEAARAEAKKTIEEALIAAQSQIEARQKQMQKELEEETMNLVVEVVQKILQKNLSRKEKEQMTKQAILELREKI